MSAFDGEIDFRSVYMVDYKSKSIPFPPRVKGTCDNCLIVGVSRDALKVKDVPRKIPDVLCPLEPEYYKKGVERFKDDYPGLAKKYMTKDVDPKPIENEIQDIKRTEYLVKHCSRDLPFMSVNLARRAKAMQTLHLPDDIYIPDTTYLGSYRQPDDEKYEEHPSKMSMRPKYDDKLRRELRRILRVNTGETSYDVSHGLLAKVILEKNPFGPPREEPKYGRWKSRYMYTYRL
ncbi:uncharacterized protein LOC113236319 [Hyposmocoma kahamanoa]|uniref:uncharacterized protein LOC113236319 n=1 Tax=Hyposmocoma kahamanoa TaxID=1477025 RepID=UPI000E6D6FBE|nr:uncharacterized protein LOC113236319 [Hyposmocoma kahamanoa]